MNEPRDPLQTPAKESPKLPKDMDSEFLSHHRIYPPGLPTLSELLEARLRASKEAETAEADPT